MSEPDLLIRCASHRARTPARDPVATVLQRLLLRLPPTPDAAHTTPLPPPRPAPPATSPVVVALAEALLIRRQRATKAARTRAVNKRATSPEWQRLQAIIDNPPMKGRTPRQRLAHRDTAFRQAQFDQKMLLEQDAGYARAAAREWAAGGYLARVRPPPYDLDRVEWTCRLYRHLYRTPFWAVPRDWQSVWFPREPHRFYSCGRPRDWTHEEQHLVDLTRHVLAAIEAYRDRECRHWLEQNGSRCPRPRPEDYDAPIRGLLPTPRRRHRDKPRPVTYTTPWGHRVAIPAAGIKAQQETLFALVSTAQADGRVSTT